MYLEIFIKKTFWSQVDSSCFTTSQQNCFHGKFKEADDQHCKWPSIKKELNECRKKILILIFFGCFGAKLYFFASNNPRWDDVQPKPPICILWSSPSMLLDRYLTLRSKNHLINILSFYNKLFPSYIFEGKLNSTLYGGNSGLSYCFRYSSRYLIK